MKQHIIPIIVCGVALFIWGFISWVVLPWHNVTIHQLTDEDQVAQILAQNAPNDGVYYLPREMDNESTSHRFAAFINVVHQHTSNLNLNLTIDLIMRCVVAGVLWLMLCCTSHLSYFRAVCLVTAVSGFSALSVHIARWNWFSFSADFIIIEILDVLVTSLIAGLILAYFYQRKNQMSFSA